MKTFYILFEHDGVRLETLVVEVDKEWAEIKFRQRHPDAKIVLIREEK